MQESNVYIELILEGNNDFTIWTEFSYVVEKEKKQLVVNFGWDGWSRNFQSFFFFFCQIFVAYHQAEVLKFRSKRISRFVFFFWKKKKRFDYSKVSNSETNSLKI